MQAIGAAGSSAVGRYVTTPVTAPGMQLTGGAAPATGTTAAADPLAEFTTPIELELIAPTPEELADAHAFAGRSSIPLKIKDVAPNALIEIDRLDQPVERGSVALEHRRNALRQAVIDGRVDPKQAQRILDDLDKIIEAKKKAEEKKQFIKDLLISLMLGTLSPAMIAKAKSLGLIVFVIDAITALAQRGKLPPKAAAAMSKVLAQFSITLPALDEVVVRDKLARTKEEDEARRAAELASRGLDPTRAGPDAPLATAIDGVARLDADPSRSLR